jgi:response regulator of citrate/malate metabolism
MDKLSTRKKAILDVIDEEIEELEEKLAKAQPLIDELNQLKRTRATLLSERSTTGSVGRKAQLTMEMVIHAFREHGDMTANELAEHTGVNVTIARSHLNRYRDQRYAQNGDGQWRLIGEEAEEK